MIRAIFSTRRKLGSRAKFARIKSIEAASTPTMTMGFVFMLRSWFPPIRRCESRRLVRKVSGQLGEMVLMRAAGRDKVLAIGLDACDLSFIQSRKAQLPLLANLVETKLFPSACGA